MSYLEPLPEACPPTEAEEISVERIVYRVVGGNTPDASDFRSQRALNPSAKYKLSECIARGLSVYTDQVDCERILKLPRYKGNGKVCKVRLESGAGKISKTSGKSHHTWWPLATFDIIGHCEVLP